jgi:RNA polymerase sigma factor (sigma-70 family)
VTAASSSLPSAPSVPDLLRELAPQVLGVVMRRYRDFDTAEDAVQEALLAAAMHWPAEGLPDNPRGWLIQVALRRLTDQMRSEGARRKREDTVAAELQEEQAAASEPELIATGGLGAVEPDGDDTLLLLFMCCHPALTPASAIALTLRAVGGLTTAEIATAFLVPEATMAQRISRAKQTLKNAGKNGGKTAAGDGADLRASFEIPSVAERGQRLAAVLHVLYLMFNEGYTSSGGPALQRHDLSEDAIRLTRAVHRQLPEDGEVTGLLALMLLTDARRAARTSADGDIIPLADQDRGLWDRAAIAEGVQLVTAAFSRGMVGPYQLQAAVAAIHDEAARAADTDWPQIVALYTLLERMSDNPMVRLNRAIAIAMVQGPRAGLDLLATLDADERLAGHHRLHAVRAHLLEMAGDLAEASAEYRAAATRTTSLPEQRYLLERAARLGGPRS